MRGRRWGSWLLVLALTAALLSGCGAAGESAAATADTASGNWAEAPMADQTEAVAEEMGMAGTDGVRSEPATDQSKLIYTGNLELETTEFDAVLEGLTALVEESGGYVESSSVRNRGSGYRSADYTVRVPAERYGDFFSRAGELCHVVWKNEEVQNVSEDYYDTAGRLKTQQTKLERLQELLGRAESMEDIITIESAISETEAAIESLSGQLRHYDALVDYATVYLSVQEVYKLSGTEEPATGFAGRLGAAFASGWQGFLNLLESLAVALAYGWVLVVVLAAAALVAVRTLRRRRRREEPEKKPDDKRL